MNQNYPIPKTKHRVEERIKRSRFIATAAHTPTPEQAKTFITTIKTEFPDATHHCWAYNAGANYRRLPKIMWKILRQLLSNPSESDDRERNIRYSVKMLQLAGSPGYPTPEDELRVMVEKQSDRSYYPVGVLRHIAAALATGDIRSYTRQVKAPSLVIHGKDDPLLRPEAGLDVAMNLPEATMRIYKGMGHDLPVELIPDQIDLIDAHIQNRCEN